MEDKNPLDAESLDLPPSRELDEAAALLAYAAAERKPPAHLKDRLMASIHPAAPPFPLKRWAWPAVAAMAAAALLVVFRQRAPVVEASLVAARGEVLIDGRAASAGARVGWDSVIEVRGEGEAVVRVDGRAGFRLSQGGRAALLRGENGALLVRLSEGWLLNAVKTGTPYAVVSEHSRVSALGTDFIVKVRDGRAYACICHGRIALEGDFPRKEMASAGHAASMEPLYEPGPEGPLDGHSDEDIARLRALVGLER